MTAADTLSRESAIRETRVLTKAVSRVAAHWQLTNEYLGEVLGISDSSASRLRSGAFELKEGTKSFEVAQHLIRIFRSLDALTGSDDASSMSWLNSDNADLGAKPADLMKRIQGLLDVANYVDDFRAPV